MKLYCGIVLQKDDINITIIDDSQKEVVNENVAKEAAPVIKVLTPHRADLQSIVMEADKDPEWLIDALKADGFTNVQAVF